MDWGSLVMRRANQNPPDQGGWNAFNTVVGRTHRVQSGQFATRCAATAGRPGSAGRPTTKLEALRQAWFDAPDLAAQQAIAATNPTARAGNGAVHSTRTDFPAHGFPVRHQRRYEGGDPAVLGRPPSLTRNAGALLVCAAAEIR